MQVSAQLGYVPSEDDRPESAPNVPTEITLAQELLLKQYESQVERLSKKDCQELALEIARQMMVKVRTAPSVFRICATLFLFCMANDLLTALRFNRRVGQYFEINTQERLAVRCGPA